MDPDVARVMRGYARLTMAQRSAFVRQLNEYNEGTSAAQERIIKEAIEKSQRMDVGPTSGSCPCCGR
jgi:hypothetical protein